MKVGFDDVESSDAGGALEVQSCSVRGEEFGCASPPIGQAARDRRVLVSGQRWFLDLRAVVQQKLEQGLLHSGHFGMDTGCRQTQGGASAAVDIGFGVDLSFELQQEICD